MSKLTGIIIAKNEEDIIVDAIESISFCDEIIVVDNASSDNTKALAEKKGVTVLTFQTSNFSQLRNEGLQRAQGEWILYIDADERVSDSLRGDIEQVVKENTDTYSAYQVVRKNFYLGNHPWPTQEKILRLFKKDHLQKWSGELHESPVITGNTEILKGYLYHYTHRNLEYMLQKTIHWSDIEAQLRFSAHHPPMSWWRFPRVMIPAFLQSYIIQGGWKLGTVGLIESMYQAFSIFITYAKLWELQIKEKNHGKNN